MCDRYHRPSGQCRLPHRPDTRAPDTPDASLHTSRSDERGSLDGGVAVEDDSYTEPNACSAAYPCRFCVPRQSAVLSAKTLCTFLSSTRHTQPPDPGPDIRSPPPRRSTCRRGGESTSPENLGRRVRPRTARLSSARRKSATPTENPQCSWSGSCFYLDHVAQAEGGRSVSGALLA